VSPPPENGVVVTQARGRPAALPAILLLALSLQVALAFALASRGDGGDDSVEYRQHAVQLLERGVYSFDGVTPGRMRQPLYPLFLAAIYGAFGYRDGAVFLVQALLCTATVFLTWRLARALGVADGPAVAAAALVAVYPPFARLSGLLLTESLSTLLLMLSALLFVAAAAQPRPGRALALGVVVGVHTLCRPATAMLPVWLPVLFWLVLGDRRRVLRVAGWTALGFMLAVSPWLARNAITLGVPSFLSTEGGAGMYVGGRPDAERIWSEGLMPFLRSEEARAIVGDRYYSSEEANARFRALALDRLRSQPLQVLLHGALQTAKAWLYMPGARVLGRDHPWRWFPLIGIPALLLALALYGSLVSRDWTTRALLLGLPAYYTAVHLPLLAVPRHMLPLFPLVAIGAMAGAASLTGRTAGLRLPRPPILGLPAPASDAASRGEDGAS
jgi:4-amino-4-deoxy-L-arabinose transferase-like glycosyltransferase